MGLLLAGWVDGGPSAGQLDGWVHQMGGQLEGVLGSRRPATMVGAPRHALKLRYFSKELLAILAVVAPSLLIGVSWGDPDSVVPFFGIELGQTGGYMDVGRGGTRAQGQGDDPKGS